MSRPLRAFALFCLVAAPRAARADEGATTVPQAAPSPVIRRLPDKWGGPTVRVRLPEVPEPFTLALGGGAPVCTSPCEAEVAQGYGHRLLLRDEIATGIFPIWNGGDLKARFGSRGRRVAGQWMLLVGGPIALGSFGLLGLWALASSAGSGRGSKTVPVTAGVVGGVNLVVAGVGFYLMVRNSPEVTIGGKSVASRGLVLTPGGVAF